MYTHRAYAQIMYSSAEAHELPVSAIYCPFVIPRKETECFAKQSASQLSLMPV